ncbi:HTH-type transcriptional regulator DmlR [Comamonas aquatilis]|uniref:LysR family transcriptional regulator n=1 Tax=Comamonas aquatilis TaxID=1778406 RepID=UPI0039F0411D
MKALRDLDIFVRTADTGSLSATARSLDLTPAATSAALKRLEEELGVQLFLRSTRNLRLTSQGELFLEHCRPAVASLQQASQELAAGEKALQGVLKMSAPSDLGRNLLFTWLTEFQKLHPKVEIRLHLSDRMANIYSDPVDVAFRYGKPPDSSLVALPLATSNRRVLCASPSYIAQHGAPSTPYELPQRDCLCFMLDEEIHDRWRFSHNGTSEISVKVKSANVSNDGDAVRRWALLGKGIAYKSQLDVLNDLNERRLLVLCPDWTTETTPLFMIVPSRRQLTPLLRKLCDYIAHQVSEALISLRSDRYCDF